MGYTELRLKIRRFFKKYKKIIFVALSIFAIIVFINYWLRNRKVVPEKTTTYEPHISIMDTSSSAPVSMQDPIEELIKQYVTYCNENKFQEAFWMLSEECREHEFNNSPSEFISHVMTKMPSQRTYSIQNYSNISLAMGKIYIYEVKYTEDLLATGLTNSEYMYTSEKMAFYRDNDGNIKMSVGGYIYHTPIQSISENEYLKIDVLEKYVNYTTEVYSVKFTNRSEYTVVISDGYGKDEVQLQLPNEKRNVENLQHTKILVLKPGESITQNFAFSKYVDDGDVSQNITFGAIRVMENYSGVDNVEESIIQNEIDNAIAKFSMNVSVLEK